VAVTVHHDLTAALLLSQQQRDQRRAFGQPLGNDLEDARPDIGFVQLADQVANVVEPLRRDVMNGDDEVAR
jgi:hypothetical protein